MIVYESIQKIDALISTRLVAIAFNEIQPVEFCYRKIECGIFMFMNVVGNLVWLIFGGLFAAIGYLIGGIVLCVTIIGVPWGLQCFKMAGLVLLPFGRKIVSDSSNTGCLSVFCNIVWILFGGWYTALVHIGMGILLSITIIGIPWARQHFKLIEISLMPFGKRVE